jgi:hypothetical protein
MSLYVKMVQQNRKVIGTDAKGGVLHVQVHHDHQIHQIQHDLHDLQMVLPHNNDLGSLYWDSVAPNICDTSESKKIELDG